MRDFRKIIGASIVTALFVLALPIVAQYNVSNYLEQGGSRTVIGGSLDVVSGGDLDIESGGAIKIAGTAITSSAAELNAADGATAGTVVASKLVAVDANKDIGDFRNLDVTNLDAGKSGTAGSLDIFPTTAAKGKITISAADSAGDTTTTITNASQAAARTYTLADVGSNDYFAMFSAAPTAGIDATQAEIDAVADKSVNGIQRVYKYSIASTPTGAEQDTGIDLPLQGIVHGCWIDVTTAEATAASKLIDVGLLASESGDTDGFLDGVSVAALGTVTGTPTFTAGGNETYFASSTVGDLLAPTQVAGSDVATDVGTYIERPHILDGTAKSLVYDADGADWAEFRGDIICLVTEW